MPEFKYFELSSSFVFDSGLDDLNGYVKSALQILDDIDFHVKNLVSSRPGIMDFSKWADHLPARLKCKLLKEKYFDFEGASVFLTHLNFVAVSED